MATTQEFYFRKATGGELADDLIVAVDKPTANIDEIVKIRVFGDDGNFNIFTNQGSVKKTRSGVFEEIEEDITFINSSEEYLRLPASEIVSFSWIGSYQGGGRPAFIGKKIRLPQKTIGILRVKYKTGYSEYEASADKAGTQLIVFNDGKRYKDVQIVRNDYKKEVVLKVVDIYTGVVLPGASVYLDGRFKGITDANGTINLGKLAKGEYKLKVVKAGYKPNDQDNIQNEILRVD